MLREVPLVPFEIERSVDPVAERLFLGLTQDARAGLTCRCMVSVDVGHERVHA